MEHQIFAASHMKLSRAAAFTEELERKQERYGKGDPIKFTLTENQAQFSLRIQTQPVDPIAGAIFGDAIHNLRTALDLMATELVPVNGDDINKVYFPFAASAKELDAAIKQRKFDLAGAEAVELLRSLQPYKDGNKLLRYLHDLDIQDKHRALILIPADISHMDVNVEINPGTRRPTGNIRMDAASIFFCLPGQAGIGQVPAIQLLKDFMELVQGILKAFARIATKT